MLNIDNPVPSEPEKHYEEHSNLEPVGNFFWDIIKVLLVSLAVIIPIRYFLFQPFVVSGSSMEPNFSNGDYLIINELSYRFESPARGDVIVLRFPKDPSQFFIKRIVGLPGERVVIENGQVTISKDGQNQVLNEQYLPDNIATAGKFNILLSDSQYFVLGDNRPASSDSRSWGTLNRDLILGKVWLRVLPFSSFLVFHTPDYQANF